MPIIVAALTQGQVLFLQYSILCSEAWISGAFYQQTESTSSHLYFISPTLLAGYSDLADCVCAVVAKIHVQIARFVFGLPV